MKAIYYVLFILLISGVLFTSCAPKSTEDGEDTVAETEQVIEVDDLMMEDEEEGKIEELELKDSQSIPVKTETSTSQSTEPKKTQTDPVPESEPEKSVEVKNTEEMKVEVEVKTEEKEEELSPQEETAPVEESVTTIYADGTYSYTGSYSSPAGNESVFVSFTIANDLITAVTVTPQAINSTSKSYQEKFAAGVADVVLGKKVDQASVGKVNGSSLTPTGFNNALATLKSGAQN